MRMSLKAAHMARALVGVGFVGACADSATSPTSSKFVSEVNLAEGAVTTNAPALGVIKVCKAGNAGGSFDVTRSALGASTGTVSGLNSLIATGTCEIVAEDNGASGIGSVVTIVEDAAANTVGAVTACVFIGVAGSGPCLLNLASYAVNSFHGFVITYTNTFTPPSPPSSPPPPLAICDFITFGRLVVQVGGQRVVISGNAGNSIKNEFHIRASGVDNHVADAITYGPIVAGPLSGPAFPNSRIVTGIAKDGVRVELRLWDGGAPGKGADRVYVKLNGGELFSPALSAPLIDRGNMQYHSNCRG